MKHKCPICSKNMSFIARSKSSSDYFCDDGDDHHYAERVSDGYFTVCKLRIGDMPTDERLYLKVNFTDGNSEIWRGIDSQKRIKVAEVISIQSSLDKMRNKIETYITFS